MLSQFNYGQLCGIFASIGGICLNNNDWVLAIVSGILSILILITKAGYFNKKSNVAGERPLFETKINNRRTAVAVRSNGWLSSKE